MCMSPPPTAGRFNGTGAKWHESFCFGTSTPANLLNTLSTLKNRVDSTDHFFFYSFDHGGGTEKTTTTTGEEVLCGWGGNIRDDELAPALLAINGKANAYVFTQCFAGGMIDDMGTLGSNRHASSATNHYEFSWGDGFARAYQQALAAGWRWSDNLFNQAKANDPFTAAGTYADNGGTWTNQKEHPWDTGGSFRVFRDWFDGLTSTRAPLFSSYTRTLAFFGRNSNAVSVPMEVSREVPAAANTVPAVEATSQTSASVEVPGGRRSTRALDALFATMGEA